MISHLLTHSLTFQRPTADKGAGGDYQPEYQNIYTSVAASVQPATATSVLYWQQFNITISHIIFVEKEMVLLPGDIILFGDRQLYFNGMRNLIELGRVWEIAATEYLSLTTRPR